MRLRTRDHAHEVRRHVTSLPLTNSPRQVKYIAKAFWCREKEVSLTESPRFHNLDRVDCAIIGALQVNGRESFAEIGKAIGLSATSVAERIRRLEQSGIIEGYGARISASRLGYPVTAFILARPNGPDARFVQVARKRPEIRACYRVTGDFSFIAHAVVRDVTHLEQLLNDLEPATVHVVTLVVLSTSFEGIPINVGDAS
jgi:Lrp/AsnC family transcriptional regulator, leucine-responsive regulatory protein